jgi:hypothetical protein
MIREINLTCGNAARWERLEPQSSDEDAHNVFSVWIGPLAQGPLRIRLVWAAWVAARTQVTVPVHVS